MVRNAAARSTLIMEQCLTASGSWVKPYGDGQTPAPSASWRWALPPAVHSRGRRRFVRGRVVLGYRSHVGRRRKLDLAGRGVQQGLPGTPSEFCGRGGRYDGGRTQWR